MSCGSVLAGMNSRLEAVLACPRCHGELAAGTESIRCRGCAAEFSLAGGIPRLNDGAVDRDPRIAAEWEAQHHAHALYTDRQSIANQWEEQVLPRLVEWLSGTDGPILDLGCGVGHFGRTWAARGRHDLDLVGMDLQVELLEDARHGYVGLVEGDVHRLPVKDGVFGAVVVANTLHHVSDPGRALLEIQRVLRPGGIVVAYDPRELRVIEAIKKVVRRKNNAFTEYHRAFRPDEYRDMFTGAGLQLERFASVDPFGPLFATGLDLVRAGRLGVASPVARALARLDSIIERADRTRDFGLMLMALARKPPAGFSRKTVQV